MLVLDAMDLATWHMVHGKLSAQHWGKEGTDHSRCRCCGRAFGAGHGLVMVAAIPADLPLEHRLHEPSHTGEQSSCRNPFWFLQPYRADGCGILDPAKARFHGDVLFLIGLEQLGIRTLLRRHRGGQDSPPRHVLGGNQGLSRHDQAIADFDLRGLGLRRTASVRPLFGGGDGCHTLAERMLAPETRRAAPPARPPACIAGNGRLGVGRTGTPAGCHARDGLGDALGLLGVGGGVGAGRLLSQWAGVYAAKTARGHRKPPVRVFHGHWACATVPVPAPSGLLPCPAWLFEQQRQRPLRLAPRRSLLPPRTGARRQRDEPDPPPEAQAPWAFTRGRTIGHHAAHAVESEGQTLLKGHGGRCAGTGRAITNAHTAREALTTHGETQEDRLALIPPLLAVPRGRPRRNRSCAWGDLRCIGSVEGDRRGTLMEPGGREGIDFQGVACDRPQHAVERRGHPRIEALPRSVIMPRGAAEAGLEQG
jgi:hypothetical protein